MILTEATEARYTFGSVLRLGSMYNLVFLTLERLSLDCRKTKTKTKTNPFRQSSENPSIEVI